MSRPGSSDACGPGAETRCRSEGWLQPGEQGAGPEGQEGQVRAPSSRGCGRTHWLGTWGAQEGHVATRRDQGFRAIELEFGGAESEYETHE